ncbi:MAG: response regulator [Clostridia bacterium]|nr:response regulator [Clostridia bacterium]
MYKLLVVDDESMIRDGIVKGIPWQSLGYEICGEAENGLAAIGKLNECSPDVIISDIRMPQMDGIELMEYLSQKHPSIKMIILSGYSDFDYLKKSIKNNVYDYLLKPTRINTFVELFTKLKVEMDEEALKKQEYDTLKKRLVENLPYLEQIFLNQLVTGFYHDEKEINEKKNFYNIPMLEGKLAVVVVEIDNPQSILEVSEEKKQLLNLYIIQVATRIVEETIQGKFFISNDGSIIGICCLNASMNNLINVIKEIQKNVFEHRKLSISFGVSNAFDNILEISGYYLQAKQAIKQKICLDNQSIILFSDLESIIENDLPAVSFDTEKITDLVFGNKNDELSEYIHLVLNRLKNKMFKSFEPMDVSILKMIFEVDNYFYQYGVSIKRILEEMDSGYLDIYQKNSLDLKKDWLISILVQVSQEVNRKRTEKISGIICEVKRYIEKSFCSNSLCLESVAELFKKSPPYLSKLFKEETGENFSDYITRLRMEKAKELLKDITVKAYEVGEKVGYADISHFSRKFKSYTGMSPSQFRGE